MSRLYVGNLPLDIKEREIDDLFYKFGRIRNIEIKRPNRPPAFAFIEFDDRRDAEDAVRRRDGYDFDGGRLRVEISKGSRDRDSRGGASGGASNVKRRSDFRVKVTGLPKSCSWQDLKDFMRKAGDVIFTDVDREGGGVVEYSNKDDMDYAIKKLDDTEFKNPYDSTFIRVYADGSSGGAEKSSRGRSRSRSDSRSRSRSLSRDRSRSRDRKRSHSRSSSRSRSRSPEADKKAASPRSEK